MAWVSPIHNCVVLWMLYYILDVVVPSILLNWLSVVLLGYFEAVVGYLPSVACWMNYVC